MSPNLWLFIFTGAWCDVIGKINAQTELAEYGQVQTCSWKTDTHSEFDLKMAKWEKDFLKKQNKT